MVLDTSAIVAAIAMEPDAVRFRAAMLGATSLAMSAAAVLESRIVLRSRHGDAAVDAFDQMLDGAGIAIVPFDAPMAQLAFNAFRRYGKGQGRYPASAVLRTSPRPHERSLGARLVTYADDLHPAQLNIIDCAVYALAKMRGESLLFKGSDFGD